MKQTLAIIAFLLISCGTQEQESVTPNTPQNKPQPATPKSARVADDCESITYGNGLTIDGCEVGLGGLLTRQVEVDGQSMFPFSLLNLQGFHVESVDPVSLDAHTTDFMQEASVGANYGEAQIMASNHTTGKESLIDVTTANIEIHTIDGEVEILTGGTDGYQTRIHIDASGNIIFPKLKAKTIAMPVNALYDSAGFVKRKH